MLGIATIGTSFITGAFIQAVQAEPLTKMVAVYSRTQAHGEQLVQSADAADVPVKTSLAEVLADPAVDIVYIASPNSLHFQQTRAALLAGKHVITEKPAFTNPAQFAEIERILNSRPTQYYFEAARHIHTPNFKRLQQALEGHQVSGAAFSYAKYSSRYDALLAGQTPNIFSPRFAGGALQDLGVYLVYAAVALFGKPLAAHYLPTMLESGVDGGGIGRLDYNGFNVVLRPDKTVESRLPSEIYLGKDTLWTENIAELPSVRLYHGNGEDYTDLGTAQPANGMGPELHDFATIIQDKDRSRFADLLQLSARVNEVLFAMRQDAGIQFPVNVEAVPVDE
ncbi:MAG: Gfo/Idh/MocA family oxidoreductase [Schleiferilactobacillus harbinensis]|jgi:predicted dehydrogenase|nr:Gfo/Idh/MocA family oxidoreductase [Schleiferilactobacillus harbinensis]MCI1911869.1 Gfo/Idh/MocA family oxidoreductase [Schleiferilactobacillus harbinensis]